MEKENFIKTINDIKEKTSLDLSIAEDLSIALMNLISLEEHFLFSYMKTGGEKFLEFLDNVREIRKKLLKKIVQKKENDDSEKWCISKHLLAASMRLNEVGTKYLHEGKTNEARDLFNESFNTYNLFWIVNGIINVENQKIKDSKISKISQLMKKLIDCCKE